MATAKTATLAKFGLTAALSFAGAVTFLSAITGTTGTFSGTVTAPTLTNSSGSYVIDNSGVDVSRKTVEAATFSGSYLKVVKATTGSGTTSIDGSTGGRICLRDRAGSAWTVCAATTGTLACRVAQSGECP